MGGGLLVFFLLGLVSLFADMAYEGARSVVGPYLGMLGAGLVVVGGVSVGEVVSHLGRLLGGFLAHRVRSSGFYWGLLFSGYLVNLGAVPLLAFAGRWEEAFVLVVLERLGKGLRAPVRDLLLAEVGQGLGRGKLYAVHEFLDQLGAVSGPLLVALALSRGGGDYSLGFKLLALPGGMALLLLLAAYRLHPVVGEARVKPGGAPVPRVFIVYAAAAGLSMAGLVHWAQASYRVAGVGAEVIALAYALAMLVDGMVALAMGWAYDRFSRRVVLLTPLLTLFATLSMLVPGVPIYAAAVIWGAALAGFESVYRSAAADLLPVGSRALGFGLLYFALGGGWTLGNLMMALLPLGGIIVFVTVVESAALFLMWRSL